MAPYDSESEDEDFTETNVLLGYTSREPNGDSISHLGGQPEWLDPTEPASSALARCKVCKDLMNLILQLNGELPDQFPDHERRIYIFSCRKNSCRRKSGSIRALRGLHIALGSNAYIHAGNNAQKKKASTANENFEEDEEKEKPQTNLGETLFGTKGLGPSSTVNPFSTPTSTLSSSNPFASSSNPFANPTPQSESLHDENKKAPSELTTSKAIEESIKTLPKTFAETLSLGIAKNPEEAPLPSEPWPAEADMPKAYPISYFSEVGYETLDPTPPPVPQAAVQMDVDDMPASGGGKDDRLAFQEDSMDRDFQKFADRIAQNPDQCIRYEFGGQPLLYSKSDTVGRMLDGNRGMPRCENCGTGRIFEVQLTPRAIEELEAEELDLEGMDWGTIIVGVCESDCQAGSVEQGKTGYLEEWVGVQWEELGASR